MKTLKCSIFDQFVLWLIRSKDTVTISTGIAFGHKIYSQGPFRFIELDDNKVCIEGPSFSLYATTAEDLVSFSKAIVETPVKKK